MTTAPPSATGGRYSPAAPREDYSSELAEVLGSGRQVSLEELLDLWARHDTYPPP